MKKHVLEFLKRGLAAMGFGPLILALIYAILGAAGVAREVGIGQAALAIASISLLAFVAAGITVVYQIERLPLCYAILLHGLVLYADYALIYLLNGWLGEGTLPFLIFTACFIGGYVIVWAIIYLCTRKKTDELNRKLKSHQRDQ
ncbi:MAG: DUF3021 domain-containing protein [Clostridia bacterium]|nr:DUF3021 domain-containing protein [Clostridia bacterium]